MNLKNHTKENLTMKENENTQIVEENKSWWVNVINTAMSAPGVYVDREQFLRKELTGKVSQETIERSIKEGTIKAGVPKELASKLAKNIINSKCILTTTISFASGIPGGFVGLIGGCTVDIAQYFGNFFNMAQKLMYIYGYKDVKELDSSQTDIMLAMLGAASGVEAAQFFVSKTLPEVAEKIATKIITRETAKSIFKKITDKVLIIIGKKGVSIFTAEGLGKTIIKSVPIIGGGISGAMTLATFKPMAKKLNKCLEEHYDYESVIIKGE